MSTLDEPVLDNNFDLQVSKTSYLPEVGLELSKHHKAINIRPTQPPSEFLSGHLNSKCEQRSQALHRTGHYTFPKMHKQAEYGSQYDYYCSPKNDINPNCIIGQRQNECYEANKWNTIGEHSDLYQLQSAEVKGKRPFKLFYKQLKRPHIKARMARKQEDNYKFHLSKFIPRIDRIHHNLSTPRVSQDGLF